LPVVAVELKRLVVLTIAFDGTSAVWIVGGSLFTSA
jgi:hypothetical protein